MQTFKIQLKTNYGFITVLRIYKMYDRIVLYSVIKSEKLNKTIVKTNYFSKVSG